MTRKTIDTLISASAVDARCSSAAPAESECGSWILLLACCYQEVSKDLVS